MKTFTVRPLQILIALSVLMIGTSSLRAGASNKSGNPYGNGTFFSTEGTFNGVLRGVNIVGVTQFSTSTNTTLNAGPLSIYNASSGIYDDSWFVYPTLDPSGNTLSAILTSTNNPGNVITNTGGSSNANPITTPLGAGGSFSANLHTAPPNQTYSGNGQINLTGVGQGFTINGTRISSSTN